MFNNNNPSIIHLAIFVKHFLENISPPIFACTNEWIQAFKAIFLKMSVTHALNDMWHVTNEKLHTF